MCIQGQSGLGVTVGQVNAEDSLKCSQCDDMTFFISILVCQSPHLLSHLLF